MLKIGGSVLLVLGLTVFVACGPTHSSTQLCAQAEELATNVKALTAQRVSRALIANIDANLHRGQEALDDQQYQHAHQWCQRVVVDAKWALARRQSTLIAQ